MNIKDSHIYALQVLHYLIDKYHYKMIRVKSSKDEIWLLNEKNSQFPIIYVTSDTKEEIDKDISNIKIAHKLLCDIAKKQMNLCILSTDQTTSTFVDQSYEIIGLYDHAIKEHTLIQSFPKILEVMKIDQDKKDLYKKLQKDILDLNVQANKGWRKYQNLWYQVPNITRIFIYICLIYFAITTLVGILLQDTTMGMILSGAYYKMNILAVHEYWRLFTSGFMHIDIFHLLLNMISLIYIGIGCEKFYKKWEYITIVLASILIGNLVMLITDGNQLAMGFSGALFGLLGAYVVGLYESKMIQVPMVKRSVMRIFIMNFLISLLPGIAMSAHIGGLITGVLLGICFIASDRWHHLKHHVLICFTIFMISLAIFVPQVHVIEPLRPTVDIKYYNTIKSIGLKSYSEKVLDSYLQFYVKEDFINEK